MQVTACGAGARLRPRACAGPREGLVVKRVSPPLLGVGWLVRPREGWRVKVAYTGFLQGDTAAGGIIQSDAFDSGDIRFVVGERSVVGGLDRGVRELRLGETAEIGFGPELGYGSMGFGDEVPPDTGLVFRVTLLSAWPFPKFLRDLVALFRTLLAGV